MLITNNAPVLGAFPASRGLTLSASGDSASAIPTETFTPSTDGQAKPKERYEAWVPLANAGFAALAFGIPSLAGAAGNAAFGNSLVTSLGLAAVGATAGTTYGYKSAQKENLPPIWKGFSTGAMGGIGALATPLLGAPGTIWGWKGAAVATAVAAVGAGVVSAFGIHFANKKIDAQNAALGINKG